MPADHKGRSTRTNPISTEAVLIETRWNLGLICIHKRFVDIFLQYFRTLYQLGFILMTKTNLKVLFFISTVDLKFHDDNRSSEH